MNTRSLFSTALAAGLAVVLVACSGGSDSAGSTPSPTPTTASPTPSATPTPTPTVTRSAPVPAKPRTKAELTKALLALADLPAGFSIDPSDEDDGSKLSSKDAKCASLISLFNSTNAPGAKVSVDRVFSGGQSGPYIQETLDGMGSPAAATALLAKTRAAIQSCHQAKLYISGAGTSTVAVSEVSPPKLGTSPVAVRFAASSGPLAGFEVIFVLTGLSDVILGMSFDRDTDLEEATGDAYARATKVLGTAKTGT